MFRWQAGVFRTEAREGETGQFDTLLARRAIEVSLPLVEEKRQPEGNANDTRCGDRQPAMAQRKTTSLEHHERSHNERRQQYIEAEERAHAVREQVVEKPARRDAVCREPWPEGRIRECCAKDAQDEVEMTWAHWAPFE